ncbi:MAG: catalase family peroxidase [Acidobacteriaceae bacterium]|nr:catalase family peroxidase [Acidobacteriaceae bacterium]
MSTATTTSSLSQQTLHHAKDDPRYTSIAKRVIDAFDEENGGVHAGFRPAHAKGILLTGAFTPSGEALQLTRAPHIQRSVISVTARFSDFAGIPAIHDNDPGASPRGFALRFHLAEHTHTDIIAHTIDGFPARTAEEFVEFLHAVAASKTSSAKPSPIEAFLAAHPAALAFVQTPQPAPLSFARDAYFAVNAYKFTNSNGAVRYGRYRIRPEQGPAFLDSATAAKQPEDYLFDEIRQRISRGPTKMLISVQIAAEGDTTDDSTVHWPQDRPEIAFGTVELNAVAPNNAAEQQHIIFDPIPRVDGIEPSNDPLLAVRAETYLLSGRRRRAGATS